MEVLQLTEHVHKPAAIVPLDGRADWRFGQMVGRSAAMQRLFSQMRHTTRHLRVAVIEGGAGTGKMLAARTLHELSPDPESAFVPCTAAQLFESDSGDVNTKLNFSALPLIQQSREGTLILTRTDELSPTHQVQMIELLEWIEHQHVHRAFGVTPRRLLCLCSHPLRRLASTGRLRPDLANRLSAMRFALPPLRDRLEDIPLLSELFAQQFADGYGKPVRGLMPQALQRLVQYLWPGNVRELESTIHAAALACPGQWIRSLDLPALNASALTPAPSPVAVQDEDPNLDRVIRRHIKSVLTRADGNKLRAAKMLGISRSTLYRLLDSTTISSQEQEQRARA